MTMPLATVLLPTFNARACVARAIDSVLAQTCPAFELIVVDDASTDATPNYVSEHYANDRRVRVLRLAKNGGPAHARNMGLAAARGDWIALIDADDAWRPDRLQRLLAAADDMDAVFDNMAGCDPASGAETGALFPVFPTGALTVEALLAPFAQGSRYDFGYLKPILRRAFLDNRGLRYDERLRTSEDLLLYLALLLEGARTRMVDAPLYVYTTPVSQDNGAASALSNTVPRDDDVRAALERVLVHYAGRIDMAATHAIERRIEHLRRVRPLAEFDFARRRGDYRRVAALVATDAGVRRAIIDRLRRRLVRAAPGPSPSPRAEG
jgi:succinoglycan biosynthesis protein ExoO